MTEQSPHLRNDSQSIAGSGPERVREAALDAAARLFAERGVHGVSVREIARDIGVSHTLLHLYFGSKEELLRQLFRRFDASHADALGSTEDLPEAAAALFRGLGREGDLTRVLAAALIEGIVPGHIDITPNAQHSLVDRLSRVERDGVDPRILSASLASMALGWAVGSRWMMEHLQLEDLGEDEVLAQMSSVVKRMVQDHT